MSWSERGARSSAVPTRISGLYDPLLAPIVRITLIMIFRILMVSERTALKTPIAAGYPRLDQACSIDGACSIVAMLLQAPRLAQCHLHGSHRQQPDLSRVTRARRNPGCKSSLATVIDPAQTLEGEAETSSLVEREFLAKSQLKASPAATDMGSTVQIPRNKVLTTSMIAHATNKDVNQVSRAVQTLQDVHFVAVILNKVKCRFRNHIHCLCKELHIRESQEHTVKAQLARLAQTQSPYHVSSSK